MKKYLLIISLAGLAMACLVSCEDLLDVEETFSFEHEFAVNTNETSFSSSDVVDLSASSDVIGDYGDKIKEIRVEELEIRLRRFNGSETQLLESASIVIAEPDGSGKSTIAQMDDLFLHSLLNSPIVLQTEKNGRDSMEELATSPPHRFRMYLHASVDEGPADFTAVVKVTATMVANPLN